MDREELFIKALGCLKGKRVQVDTLIQQTRAESYSEAAAMIRTIEEKGLLERIESSGSNGRVPMLYQRYRLLTQASVDELSKEEIRKELLTLHPKIKTQHYAKYRKSYLNHRQAILKISAFLKRCDQEDLPYIAINERSFEWFKNEKYLQSLIHSGETNPLEPQKKSNFLTNLGLTLDDLKVYESNESFFYYLSPTRYPQHHLLIVENKDTYVTLQKLLIEEKTLLFKGIDYPITGILYGEGFKIIDSLRTAFHHPDPLFSMPNTYYWYLGDLDYAGLQIYLLLKDTYQGLLNLDYFPHYFDYLIECFERKFPSDTWPTLLEKGKQHQVLPPERYQTLLSTEHATQIIQGLTAGGYLPQETMSQEDWRRLIKRGDHCVSRDFK